RLGRRRSLLGWRRGGRGPIAAFGSLRRGVRVGGAVVHASEGKARLHLVGGESIPLPLELMSGKPREKHTVLVLGGGEASLQGVDALLEGRDAGRELPG